MKRLIAAGAAGAAATLVSGLVVVTAGLGSTAQASGRQDIGPVPVPTEACVQYVYKGQPYYLCLNYPKLPSI